MQGIRLWDSSSTPPLPVITSKELDAYIIADVSFNSENKGSTKGTSEPVLRLWGQCVLTKADTGPIMDKGHKGECFLGLLVWKPGLYNQCTVQHRVPDFLNYIRPTCGLGSSVYRLERAKHGSTSI